MKFLICLVILVGAVIAALAYLPPETTAKIGEQTAVVTLRGCRGAKQFVSRFKEQMEKAKDTLEEAPEGNGG